MISHSCQLHAIPNRRSKRGTEDEVELKQNKVLFTLTIDSAAEIGSLTPKTVQTSELSDPAGIIPIGTEAAIF